MKISEKIISLFVFVIAIINVIGLVDTSFTDNIMKENVVAANIIKDVVLADQSIYVLYDSSYGRYVEDTSSYGSNVDLNTWNTTVTLRALPTLTHPQCSCIKQTGWYTASVGGTQITQNTKVAITSSQRLYAHWNEQHGSTYYSTTTSTHTLRYDDCAP